MHFNYQEICSDFLKELPDRAKNVVVRRFGLETDEPDTLQTIGKDLGITRERVRQIEQVSLNKIKSKTKRHGPVFDFFNNQLRTTGNLRKEDSLLKILSPERLNNQILFLLCLSNEFNRFLEDKSFYTLWTIDKQSMNLAQKAIDMASIQLKKAGHPLAAKELNSGLKIGLANLFAYLEASKIIQKGPQELWGLGSWAEINPRGVRDRAYIIFNQEKKPLHFTEVAQLINQTDIFNSSKKAHTQTVHNELIKDSRFVLVGRGLYALKDWGYKPGTVKDVLIDILKQNKKPLTKQEIINKALEQRKVAKNTILLNLHNKKYFQRTLEGKYKLTNF